MRLGRAAAPIVAFVVLAVVVAVLPSFVSAFRAQQLAYVGIYLVALIGLNVLTGYTGQISLGHGAFMAIGGYTTAILMSDHGLKDVWTIPLAALVAGIAGFLFGIPALRLSGLYLALATFAIAVSMPAVIKRFEGFTGGGTGINLFGIPELTASLAPVSILGREVSFNDWLYYLSWSIALVGYVVAWLLLRGRAGLALRAVRDSETAAQSSGVSDAVSSGMPNRLIPVPPPVKPSKRLITAGMETAIANVARARYSPDSRRAGIPNRKPATPATSPASGIVQMSFTPWSAIRIAVVYPPSAMNAPWPSEIWPV